MKSNSLSRETLTKIFTTYWNAPCKYRQNSNEAWARGYVRGNCLPLIESGNCIILLKDLDELERSNLDKISKIMSGDDNEYEDATTDEQVKEHAEHMKSVVKEIPCAVADYLRREGFHVPVYGIDLFNFGLAERIGRRNFVNNKPTTSSNPDRKKIQAKPSRYKYTNINTKK